MPLRLSIAAKGTATGDEVRTNFKKAKKYTRVKWDMFKYPVCAVVGGGVSVESRLETLRNWHGDIFAINDTGKYLSDNGISCTLYAIDTTPIPYKIGPLVKDAIFASRVHKNQFDMMKHRPVSVFDMAEEDPRTGIEGGPTAVCRTPHLFLKMGYRGIKFFGIDGSFELNNTHVSGYSKAAYDNMIIVTAGEKEFFTNAAFMLQHGYMTDVLTKWDKFFSLDCDGLIKGMLEHPDTWTVTAIADDLKNKYEDQGCMIWDRKYSGGNKLWPPPATLSPQRL